MHRSRLALLLSTLVAFSSPTFAQVNDAKRASYRAAFEETLRRPGDAEVLLKYAQAAAAAEDYEGAITAYERFLVLDADQPRVKFELGVLYYKLKSYDAARTYFEAARTSAKSRTRRKRRFAIRGVPRARRAISSAPSVSASSASFRAERLTISDRSSIS